MINCSPSEVHKPLGVSLNGENLGLGEIFQVSGLVGGGGVV